MIKWLDLLAIKTSRRDLWNFVDIFGNESMRTRLLFLLRIRKLLFHIWTDSRDILIIFFKIDLMTAAASKPCAIAYNSNVRTLLVTCLHLVDDQCTRFAFPESSASTITYSIWENKFQLFAKKASVNTTIFMIGTSSWTKRMPRFEFFICHCSRLFNVFASFSWGLTTWAVNERSKATSNWHTVAMYAPRARWATYFWCHRFSNLSSSGGEINWLFESHET